MTKISDVLTRIGPGKRSIESRDRTRFPSSVKRILVPTDLTIESEKAIEFGLVLARLFGAQLTLFHVYHEPYSIEYLRGPCAYNAVLENRRYSASILNSIAEDVKKRYSDCDAEFCDGVPSEEIVRMASEQKIDLIVVSTHHYNWLGRLAYGCDSERILRDAPCPVLIL